MNDERHIEENLQIADEALPGSLTDKELALVARAKDEYRKLMKVGCTGCHYCLPCPAGVNIPACFEQYNNLGLGNPMMAKIMYLTNVGGGLDGSGKKGYASQCKGCNKCVKACTQHIEIPARLKEASKALETPDMKIEVSGDTAFAYGLERIAGKTTSGAPVDMWLRYTEGLKNIDGKWRVVHEHISVPADMATGKAAMDLKP
jgi:ketosteroid isomerase-like protein